jgi:DNA-binding response OmpR family regulator
MLFSLDANVTAAHVIEHAPQAIPLCPNIAVSPENAAQIVRASAEPDAEIFFDESLSPITSVDLKEIHRLARFLPVIVLIPRSTGAHQVAPHQSSVAKPSSERSETTDLLGVLGKAVERFKSTSGGSMVAFGDVTINFSAMEALRKGEPVVLTTMEFKTLKYLIQNARRVISRDELLNEVWGYENYPCTRTVDNHILRLRQKLERNPSRPVHFRTMHGAGYKFLP